MMDFITELFDQWLNELSDAFSSWWREVLLASRQLAPSLPIVLGGWVEFTVRFSAFAQFMVRRNAELAGDVLGAGSIALVRTVSRRIIELLPREFSWTAMSRKQAVSDALTTIAAAGVSTAQLQLPIGLRFVSWTGRIQKVFLIGKPTALLAKVLGGITLLLAKLLIFTLYTFYSLIATVAVISILWKFKRDLDGGVIFQGFSQKAPRKKVHPREGGVIRRRAPGGSPP